MHGWGDIRAELQQSATGNGGAPDFDAVRRKYLVALSQLTGRDTVIYYTNWLMASSTHETAIALGDMQGLMETFYQLRPRTAISVGDDHTLGE